MSDLVPFHSGQVRNFNLLVLGQVIIKLIQFCTLNWMNYFKLECCLENSVDSGSRLFSIKFISGFILFSKSLCLVSAQ